MSDPSHVEHGNLSDARSAKDAADMCCPFMDGKKCVAFKCMGWRWIGYAYETTKTPIGMGPEGSGWLSLGQVDGMSVWKRPRNNETRKGYCGAVPSTARVIERDL